MKFETDREIEFFEEVLFPFLLADEIMCRTYLIELQKRGCAYSIPVMQMTHQECITAATKIYALLKIKEKEEKNNAPKPC